MGIPLLEAAWNDRSGRSVAEAFVPDGVRIEFALPGMRVEGREAIAVHAQAYVDAVPDCRLEIGRSFRATAGRPSSGPSGAPTAAICPASPPAARRYASRASASARWRAT